MDKGIVGSVYVSNNAMSRVTSRDTWPPTWLADSQLATVASEKPTAPPPAEIPRAKTDKMSVLLPTDPSEPSDWETAEPMQWCPVCGSFDLWWDVTNEVHCQRCNPPRDVRRLFDMVDRINRRSNQA